MPKVKIFKEHISGKYVEVQINVDNKTGVFSAKLPEFMSEEDSKHDTIIHDGSLPKLEDLLRYMVKEFLAEAESSTNHIIIHFGLSGIYANGSEFDKTAFSDYTDYVKLKSDIAVKEVNSISKKVVWYWGRINNEGEIVKYRRIQDVWKETPNGTIIDWDADAYTQLKKAETLLNTAGARITEVLSQEPQKILETLTSSKLLGDGS